jgi:hypothetical protein
VWASRRQRLPSRLFEERSPRVDLRMRH